MFIFKLSHHKNVINISRYVVTTVIFSPVRFQLLTSASMKMTAFWDIAPCSVADRRFRGAYHRPDDGVCMHIC
jgi:hypothetical protein